MASLLGESGHITSSHKSQSVNRRSKKYVSHTDGTRGWMGACLLVVQGCQAVFLNWVGRLSSSRLSQKEFEFLFCSVGWMGSAVGQVCMVLCCFLSLLLLTYIHT